MYMKQYLAYIQTNTLALTCIHAYEMILHGSKINLRIRCIKK